ncbi:MAG: hypothetical protein DRP26_04070 [Candidatus Zixiibacteriota bacterium]|nr:MAG: hypothetical protein DRP26_04070 [candidate division Zixibacteria bacterium]
MISVEKALQIVLDSIEVQEPMNIPILSARGKVLAEDVISPEDIPSFDYASITGYALRSTDTVGTTSSNPVQLHLDGELLPGQQWQTPLKSKHTLRISMGAPLPEGADTVLMEEHGVRQSSKKVLIYKVAQPGENIRLKGEDITKGKLVLPKGKSLNAADIGLLSAIGYTEIKCYRIPKVSFLTTGRELTESNGPLPTGLMRSSNRFTLYSQLAEYGAEPVDLGLSNHNKNVILNKISKGLDYDMFISSAGPAIDDFTYVKKILEQVGMDIKFWKVAIRPGKPIIFGTCGNVPIFGLSGHPFSFYIVLEQFIRPAIMKMMGKKIVKRTEVLATVTKDIKGADGVTTFMRGVVTLNDNGFTVIPNFKKTYSVSAFSTINGLIVIPANSGYIKAGSKVKVQVIAEPEG